MKLVIIKLKENTSPALWRTVDGVDVLFQCAWSYIIWHGQEMAEGLLVHHYRTLQALKPTTQSWGETRVWNSKLDNVSVNVDVWVLQSEGVKNHHYWGGGRWMRNYSSSCLTWFFSLCIWDLFVPSGSDYYHSLLHVFVFSLCHQSGKVLIDKYIYLISAG